MAFSSRYRTLAELFDQAVRAYGGREVFGAKKDGVWRYITYGELATTVGSFRAALLSLGLTRGDRVAIIANNRVEWAVAAYACLGAGIVFVPMYEAQSPAEWEFIVRDCQAKVAIVANEKVLAKARTLLDAVPTLATMIVLDPPSGAEADARVLSYEAVLARGSAPAPVAALDEGDVATLLYTSGTTGNPKGVVLTHGNLASNVSAAHDVFPLRADDRSLSFLPWSHAFGQTAELHMLVSFGASMALCEGVDKLLDNLAEVQPTVLLCVPTIFSRLYTAVQQQLAGRPPVVRRLASMALAYQARARAGGRLHAHERLIVRLVDAVVFRKVRARLGGRLRFAISGGAALSREVAEFIEAIGIVLFEGYGLTETSPVLTANSPGARRLGSVGRAFPGVRLEIDSSRGEHDADAAREYPEGEIVAYGPNVMKGYFNRPDETAAVMTADGGFRTGDMGYVDRDGFLFITGRIKEQYKLENGKYVVPSPLEDQLKLSPYIANAMVYGENRPYNVALVVPNVPAIRTWAQENDVRLAEGAEVASSLRVRELLAAEIKAHSRSFRGFERIVDFAVVPGEFTVENGLLTPKMSVKRRKVIEAHGTLLAQLYARGRPAEGAATSPAVSPA